MYAAASITRGVRRTNLVAFNMTALRDLMRRFTLLIAVACCKAQTSRLTELCIEILIIFAHDRNPFFLAIPLPTLACEFSVVFTGHHLTILLHSSLPGTLHVLVYKSSMNILRPIQRGHCRKEYPTNSGSHKIPVAPSCAI